MKDNLWHTNPAAADATRVKKPSIAKPGKPGRFSISASRLSWFLGVLRDLDEALKGNATQSFGAIEFGEGDGIDSTATKLAKDGKLFKQALDVAALIEIFDALHKEVGTADDYTDLDIKDGHKIAVFLLENREELSDAASYVLKSQTSPFPKLPPTDSVSNADSTSFKIPSSQYVASNPYRDLYGSEQRQDLPYWIRFNKLTNLIEVRVMKRHPPGYKGRHSMDCCGWVEVDAAYRQQDLHPKYSVLLPPSWIVKKMCN